EDLGYDSISHLFPTPAALAQANLDGIGMPGKRVQTLQRFAAAIASGELSLDLADGPEALVERLCALPGIGPWTAEYIALRAMGEADAFPAADLGLLKSTVWGPQG
ncbi:DNA-3-methyladenine glycosylase family protein, partial [Pseudomonas aeruginosa]